MVSPYKSMDYFHVLYNFFPLLQLPLTTVKKCMNVQIQYYEILIISLSKVQLLTHFLNHKLAVCEFSKKMILPIDILLK